MKGHTHGPVIGCPACHDDGGLRERIEAKIAAIRKAASDVAAQGQPIAEAFLNGQAQEYEALLDPPKKVTP